MRCACSGVFGSPKVFIFLIAAASSGFWRSSAAIDARWNHRLKTGTFERNVTTGRRYRPPRIRPSSTKMPEQDDQHEQHERAGSRPRTARRDRTRHDTAASGRLQGLPRRPGADPDVAGRL